MRNKEIDAINLTEAKANESIASAEETAERFERKFFIYPDKMDFAYAFLRHACLPVSPVSIYPKGQKVNSLYFDTADLDQYERSASGDFHKDKVRIRWYGDINDGWETVPVFIELKSKRGYVSNKQRQRLLVPAKCLETSRLNAGIVDRTTLIDTLAGFGFFPEQPLMPVILISFRRHRFDEILTNMRVSLDYEISSSMIAFNIGYRERELRLSGGVIEVKGPSMELPEILRHMKILDTDWSQFSKYSNCIASHLVEPGTVARSWIAGRFSL